MAARLILNADDFGLTRGINRAIAELHAAGALTSATLMATGSAFDDAITIARNHPTLGVGCHVVLTDGVPVMPPDKIRSLLGPDGRTFRPSLTHFIRDLLLGHIVPSEMESEIIAQIQRLQAAGIQPTHLDTHKHTHIFPAVITSLLKAAERTGVPAIRNPFEPAFARHAANATLKRRAQISLLNRFKPQYQRIATSAHTTDGTIGISATGNLNDATLRDTLAALPSSGTFELCCHPGYNDADLDPIPTRLRSHRDAERQALLSAFSANSPHPSLPHLINYSAL
jgi:predicted glycoside hydrolase/deacetylase ChbG (UPF0249 family)